MNGINLFDGNDYSFCVFTIKKKNAAEFRVRRSSRLQQRIENRGEASSKILEYSTSGFFKCKLCPDRIYGSWKAVRDHAKQLHKDSSGFFTCRGSTCKKQVFGTYKSFAHHLTFVHSIVSPNCIYCSKKFKTVYSYANHLNRIHANELESAPAHQCNDSRSNRAPVGVTVLKELALSMIFDSMVADDDLLDHQGSVIEQSHPSARFFNKLQE
uniref:C2H2-type domain-containing protein n=1 Tax=Romanomermis culicivorax TaxID=13658 RepID=A0A915JGU7_ROMCU